MEEQIETIMSDVDKHILIDAVQLETIIWDKRETDHSNELLIDDAWKRIENVTKHSGTRTSFSGSV